RPHLAAEGAGAIAAHHRKLGDHTLHAEGAAELLFTENDTNVVRLYGVDAQGYFKDGFHDYLVHGDKGAVNPAREGTKSAAHYARMVPAGGAVRLRLRLTKGGANAPFADFDDV